MPVKRLLTEAGELVELEDGSGYILLEDSEADDVATGYAVTFTALGRTHFSSLAGLPTFTARRGRPHFTHPPARAHFSAPPTTSHAN